MDNNSKIFISKKFLCPCCKKYFSYSYPNPRIYSAAEREFDYHITKYNWRQGIVTDIKPHHYDIMICSNCGLTALREDYEKSSENIGVKVMINNFQNKNRQSSKVFDELKKVISLPELDYTSAISLHLCAIWIILLEKDRAKINHNNLGRLYLRLAWLFREQNPDFNSSNNSHPTSSLPAILSRMAASTQTLSEEVSDFREALIKENPSLANNPDPGSLSIVNTKIEELNSIIYLIHQSLIKKKSSQQSKLGENPRRETNSFLQNLTILWCGIPTNEREALEKAVEALDFSYKNEDSDFTVEQSMGLINLITKLLLKLDKTEQALDSVTHVYKTGYREKQTLQQRLAQGKKDKSISNIDIKNIAKKISTIEYTIQQAGVQRKEIIENIFNRDKKRIEMLLAEHIKKTSEDLEKELLKAGIHESIINYMRDDGILPSKNKKKGWFKH